MTQDAISLIQAVVRDELRSFKTAELGIVTSVYPHESTSDKNNYECDVKLRNAGIELKRIPVCTPRIGAAAIPNVDDLVLIQYLHGDVHNAVITGRLYNDVDRPPESKPTECVYISPDKAESGIRRLYFEFPNGNTLLFDDDKMQLEMGKTTLVINNSGDVALESEGTVTVQAKGDTSVKASGSIDLSADGDVSLSGANVSIKAMQGASLEGTATATVKGASVKVAGMIDFSAS